MSELDYAYLAEFARVDPAGLITSVGASYTHVSARQLPGQHLLSIAGRIRARLDDPPTTLRVTASFGTTFELSIESAVDNGPQPRPYAGDRIGRLFALTTLIPLVAEGLYEVAISIEGVEVRRLAFSVVRDPTV